MRMARTGPAGPYGDSPYGDPPDGDPPEWGDPFAAPTGMVWARPSQRFAWYRRFQVLFVTIVVLILAGYYTGSRFGLLGGALAVVVVLAAGTAAMLIAERSVRAWGIAETAGDLLLTHG